MNNTEKTYIAEIKMKGKTVNSVKYADVTGWKDANINQEKKEDIQVLNENTKKIMANNALNLLQLSTMLIKSNN